MPLPPARRAAVARFGALAAAAAVAVAVLFALAIRTAAGQRLDEAAGQTIPTPPLSPAEEATQRLLDTISISSLALLGIAIMLVAVVRDRIWLAAGAGALVLGANVTTQAMKAGFDRPDLVTGGPPVAGAYPSGHTTVATSLALGLVLVSPPALRWLAALGGGLYAAAVGVAVLAVGWHRPSEVVGAQLVVVAWTGLIAACVVAGRGEGELGASSRRPPRWGAMVAAALGGAFVVVVVVTAQRRLDLVRVVDDRTALAAASAATVATCAALVTVTTSMLQGLRASRGRRRGG
jgi:hypothetical protein